MKTPKLVLHLPETGKARCPRCDATIGRVRYLKDEWETNVSVGGDGDVSVDGDYRVIESRATRASGYRPILALPLGWRFNQARGAWEMPPSKTKRHDAGRATLRNVPPLLPGEAGIERLMASGITATWPRLPGTTLVVVCPSCHAPLLVRGATNSAENFLVDLTTAP